MGNEVLEDYLKAIYSIEQESGKVSTTALARHLHLAPASVTGMIKKFSEMNLVTYTPYQGVHLTEAGTSIALEVIRHHRLIELFLAQALGVPWDKVHQEAEKWEHVLSEEMEERIDQLLEYPTHDPHGAPIPDRDGQIPQRSEICLADLQVDQRAKIAEVKDQNSEMLRYLGDMGMYPQTDILITNVAPFDGPISIRVGEAEVVLGRTLARQIFVQNVQEA